MHIAFPRAVTGSGLSSFYSLSISSFFPRPWCIQSFIVMLLPLQIFHIECFRCEQCDLKLHTGEQFGLVNEKLYCKADFETVSADGSGSPSEGKNSVCFDR